MPSVVACSVGPWVQDMYARDREDDSTVERARLAQSSKGSAGFGAEVARSADVLCRLIGPGWRAVGHLRRGDVLEGLGRELDDH